MVTDPVGHIEQTAGYTQDKLNHLQELQDKADAGDIVAKKQLEEAYLNMVTGFAPAGMIGARFKTGTPTDVPFFGAAKEIPDNLSEINKAKLQEATDRFFGNKSTAKVKDVLWHPSLYRDYPEIGNMPVSQLAFVGNETKAGFSQRNGGRILLPKVTKDTTEAELKDIHSSLLHELQHGVQMLDNMPRGASPELFETSKHTLAKKLNTVEVQARDRLDEYAKTVSKDLSWASFVFETNSAKQAKASDPKLKELADYYKKITNLRKKAEKRAPSAFEQYNKTAGEAQARAVQKRFENPIEYDNPVESSYDVPFEDLIRSPLDTTIK